MYMLLDNIHTVKPVSKSHLHEREDSNIADQRLVFRENVVIENFKSDL